MFIFSLELQYHHVHTISALTPDFSQHEDRRAVSQYMEKLSNWHYLFEKVTQIFSCKLKSNVTLLITCKKCDYITHVTCNVLPQYCSQRLHLFDLNYRKKSDIVK